MKFRDMPINRKLTVVILSTATAVLLLAGAAMIATEFVTSRSALVQDMTVRANLLGENSSAGVMFRRDEDVDEVLKILSAQKTDPHIVAVSVYDKDGKAFAQYVRPRANESPPPTAPAIGENVDRGYVQVVRPIFHEEKPVGTIYLRADLGRMYAQIAIHAGIVCGTLLIIIVMTLAVVPQLRRPIAEPILALADVANRVAKNKDYSTRAQARSNDEVGLLTDAFNQMLSEIELAHDELAVAKNAAEAASRAKDQFLAVLSHELRTPLTPVLLTISLMEELRQLTPELRADVAMIRRHVELEARLIDDLLDLTRVARGKLKLNKETTDAHLVLHDAMRICCGNRLSDVTCELQAHEHHVHADPGRFLQIFWNLLNNAQKFTPTGKRIFLRSSNPAPGRLRIEVQDEGIGIEPEALTRIFSPFEQGDPAFTRSFGGLGLGLTIAKALVDAHGGTITVSSGGSNSGSLFTVEVATVGASDQPRSTPDSTERTATLPSTATASITAGTTAAPDQAQLRVLLVEDHEGTMRVLTRLLSGAGHNVRSAGTVRDALAIAGGNTLDLVVSDLGLPDGSGLDLMRELRDRYGLRGICISGYGMEDDIARSVDAGFLQHLTKPIDISQLERAIARAVASA